MDKILFCKEAARLMSIFSCAKKTSPAPRQFIEWDLEQVQDLLYIQFMKVTFLWIDHREISRISSHKVQLQA